MLVVSIKYIEWRPVQQDHLANSPLLSSPTVPYWPVWQTRTWHHMEMALSSSSRWCMVSVLFICDDSKHLHGLQFFCSSHQSRHTFGSFYSTVLRVLSVFPIRVTVESFSRLSLMANLWKSVTAFQIIRQLLAEACPWRCMKQTVCQVLA